MRRLSAVVVTTLVMALACLPGPAAAQVDEPRVTPPFRTPRRPSTPAPFVRNTPSPTARSRASARPPVMRPVPDSGSSTARSQTITQAPDLGRKMIALTLDDGYRPDPRILDLIEQWQLRGTAFIVGTMALQHPWLVQRLAAAGWEVCSHTYGHKILTGLSPAEIEREIVRGAEAIAQVGGGPCPYFRPPAGAVNAKVVGVAKRLGYRVVNWNASISDSTSASTRTSVQVDIALRTIRPGGILLGHFGGAHSYVVLREVLSTIFAGGYRVGTVSDLLQGHDVAAPAADAGGVVIGPPAAALTGHPGVPRWTWRRASTEVPPGGWAGGASVVLGLALLCLSWGWSRRVVVLEAPLGAPVEVARPLVRR